MPDLVNAKRKLETEDNLEELVGNRVGPWPFGWF